MEDTAARGCGPEGASARTLTAGTYIILINWRDGVGELVGAKIRLAGLLIAPRKLVEARLGPSREAAGVLGHDPRVVGLGCGCHDGSERLSACSRD